MFPPLNTLKTKTPPPLPTRELWRTVLWARRSLRHSPRPAPTYSELATKGFPSITRTLSSPPRRKRTVKKKKKKSILEKCPRKEKAGRFPEGCLHPSRPVCGDFLPKAIGRRVARLGSPTLRTTFEAKKATCRILGFSLDTAAKGCPRSASIPLGALSPRSPAQPRCPARR